MPMTAPIGTATSCEDPLKRAVNWIHWLSIVSLRVAVALTFSTISPFFTNAAGTRVCGLTRTARYGVRPLSAHHSQMARTRYGLADCSDMTRGILRSRATPSGTRLYHSDGTSGQTRRARIGSRTRVEHGAPRALHAATIAWRRRAGCTAPRYLRIPRSADV